MKINFQKRNVLNVFTLLFVFLFITGCQNFSERGPVTVKKCKDVRRDLTESYSGIYTKYHCGRFGSGGLGYKTVPIGSDGFQYDSQGFKEVN